MAVLQIADKKTITTDAPSTTSGAFYAYPEDPFKELFFTFEDPTTQTTALTGPFTVIIWGRLPDTALWYIVDEWLIENVPGPTLNYVTSTIAFDYYYVQLSAAGNLATKMCYEPGSGVK